MMSATQDDDRGEYPSSSSAQRYKDCNGSYLLGKGVKEVQTPEMKAWAEAGERIHGWLSDPAFFTLDDPSEIEVAEACLEQKQRLIEKVFGDNSKSVLSIKENRFWLMDGRKKLFSGKADEVDIHEDTALIVDFKTSRGDQADSPKNMQLRTLAVATFKSWKFLPNGKGRVMTQKEIESEMKTLKRIYVAIIQPLVNREALITCYELEDLKQAEAELLDLIAKINDPNAKRVAGDQCKFCPALFKCPEAAEHLKKLFTSTDASDMAELLNLSSSAKPIIKRIEARAKEMLKENAACIPGWTLGRPSSVRSISEPFAVFKVLSDAKLITREQFLEDCVSVSIGDLEKAVAKHNNLKPAAAKDSVNAICAPFIELKAKEPSLEKL